MNGRHDIDYLLNPESVAVVGASAKPGKWGHELLKGIIEGGYKGKVYPVNPRGGEIRGLKAYPSILDVEEPIDLAIIGIRAPLVLDAVKECRQKGVKAALIITAGFAETGEEGRELQGEIVKAAGEMRIVGPNTLGVFDLGNKFNGTFLHPLIGPIDILSQGGNVAVELQINANKRGVGLNKFIHFGNQADVGLVDCLDYVRDDSNANVIVVYLEGLRRGEGGKLLEIAREVAKKKPIIALKTGATNEGARGARSHTGSLAGEDRIYDAAFRQAGVIRVQESHDLLNMAEAASKLPLMRGNRVGVLTDGGSHSAMGCDALARAGLTVETLSDETQRKLKEILLPQSIAWNPVDFAGAVDEDLTLFPKAAELILEDDNVDGLLIAGALFGGYSRWFGATNEEDVARDMAALAHKYAKPISMHNYFDMEEVPALRMMSEGGIFVHTQVETAAKCLAATWLRSEYLQRDSTVTRLRVDGKVLKTVNGIIKQAKNSRRASLFENEAKEILSQYGIPVTPSKMARNKEKAISIAQSFGYPVAAKVVSAQIIHKTDAGGVKLNLESDDQVAKAFDDILKNAKSYDKSAQVEGILISPMERKGTEVIIGVTRDEQFGPVIMFGLGGIFVEVLRDVSFKVSPLSKADAYDMIKEIKAYPILQGIRGEKPKDIDALVDIILKVAALVDDNDAIKELDLNPVFVLEEGARVIDARIILV